MLQYTLGPRASLAPLQAMQKTAEKIHRRFEQSRRAKAEACRRSHLVAQCAWQGDEL